MVHTSYCSLSPQNKRNMVVYIMHLLFDTLILLMWLEPLIGGFCGCTEAGPSHGWLLGVYLMYIVVAYLLELVWRARVDTMLALHHVVTIVIIAAFFGEVSSEIYLVADALIVLGVFAVLEQPTFVALLLKRVLPVGSAHTTRAWLVAVWFWFASKTLSVVMATLFIVRDWHMMANWTRTSYILLWMAIYGIQIWSGFIQMSILRTVRREQHGEVRLPANSDSSDDGLGLKDCEVRVEDDQPGGVKKDC
ncbi:hypothetical protein COO60DRAFT_1592298 [Scenedesmus sp. NREL 46B-D3]|nr:hypothetical protein COO60DRAFT_1592298 [Scenedesmus sp. NREL 46B-D3]